MSKVLGKLSSLVLSTVVIAFMLVLTSCEQSPGEWEKEDIVTDYGDRFEHFYRLWPGGFPDPDYEHRILFDGKEVLSYHEDDQEITIHCIYNDKIIVYDIHMNLIYRKSKEKVFQTLPIDLKEKELYPIYYQLLLQENKYTSITRMLLSSGDKYAQKVILAFARGDFSEAEKHGIYMTPSEVKLRMAYSIELVDEYHLSE